MRNIFFLFALFLISLFVLSACGIDDQPGLNDTSQLTGILRVSDSEDISNGTHFLLDENGIGHPVRSISLNLSNSQYLDNKVILYGVLNEDDLVFTVTGVSVLEVLRPASSESKPVTYKNYDFGFEIVYFDDWEKQEIYNMVTFVSPDTSFRIFIEQFPFAYSQSVFDSENKDAPLLNYAASEFSHLGDISSHLVRIGSENYEAIKLADDEYSLDYYLYRNGLVYKIGYQLDSDSSDENIEVFNAMVEKFTFVDEVVLDTSDDLDAIALEADVLDDVAPLDSTSRSLVVPESSVDFTFFESLPYSFRAKYPSSWYYAGSSSSEVGVLHHYGFSTEPVEAGNELYGLNVFSGQIPSGENILLDGKNAVRVYDGGTVRIYVALEKHNFVIFGKVEYEDFIIITAESVEKIDSVL